MKTAPNIIIATDADRVRAVLRVPRGLHNHDANRLTQSWHHAMLSSLRRAGFDMLGKGVDFDPRSTDWSGERYTDYETRELVAWRGVDASIIDDAIREANAAFDRAVAELTQEKIDWYMSRERHNEALEVCRQFGIDPAKFGVPVADNAEVIAGKKKSTRRNRSGATRTRRRTMNTKNDAPTITIFRPFPGGAYHWRLGDSVSPKQYMARDQAKRAALKAHPDATITYEPEPKRERPKKKKRAQRSRRKRAGDSLGG